MAKQIVNRNVFKANGDGTTTHILSEQIEIDAPTQEEIIAEKEAKLLAMYEELEALKQQNQ